MQNASLEAITDVEDDVLIVTLRGDIDGSAREALNVAYARVGECTAILLDFSGVEYINSTGIAVIVGLLARARADSLPISARGLSPHYREIFEVTRLCDFMTILAADDPSPTGRSGAAR